MDISEATGLRSTFFFLTMNTAMPNGSRFSLDEPWATDLLREIAERGHRIGLHGSYLSSTDRNVLAREWEALERACAGLPSGTLQRAIRQHYLMMTPGLTWREQHGSGFEFDETLGFADDIGYRAGTARTFPAYDLPRSEKLPLRVRPLHVMDVAVRDHVAMETPQVTTLRRRTWRYGGDLSILWHNSSLIDARSRRAYRELVEDLAG
jgi:peptidoglycan/xylan/chitin deacetylase (PgdA/CDA1 family)